MLRRFKEIPGFGQPAALSTDPFDLGADPAKLAAPTAFRIFRPGVNTSTKGDFLFDQKAADSVMRAFREKGATLTMDYEHQALAFPPIEAPASCSSWVPEIRQTSEGPELWAKDVHWTDRAKRQIEAREYTRFSPAFVPEPKTNRILRIINCALTNTEALNHLEPLVAANDNTNDHTHEGADMTIKCTACSKDIEDGQSVMHASHGKSGMLSALTVMGLKADAADADLVVALSEIKGFRDAIFSLTGKTEPTEALAVLNAWKANGLQVVQLSEQLAAHATSSLRSQAEGIVAAAVTAGKIAPKDRSIPKITDDELAPYIALRDGKLDDKVVAALRTTLDARNAIVSKDKVEEAEGGAVVLTSDDKIMCKRLNLDEKDLRAYKLSVAQATAGNAQ